MLQLPVGHVEREPISRLLQAEIAIQCFLEIHFDFLSRRLAMNIRLSGNRAADLSFHGIRKAEAVWWNLSRSALLEQSLRRREGHLASTGPLVVRTGEDTGRCPHDRFFVREPRS